MKKCIVWVLAIILIITVFFGVLYAIDMNRIKNNKPVVFSTWGYDYVPPVCAQEGITLDVISNLATAKGDSLTWSDFEKYKSTEMGSGLYILLYEVDENYNLMIGGIPNEKPMYIRLVSKKDTEQYIDIRYDNIQEFLEKTK